MSPRKRIYIGWTPVEMIYLQAALTLPRKEHTAAFQDIADMTHRSLSAVRTEAYRLYQIVLDDKAAQLAAARREAHERAQAQMQARMPPLAPSMLRPPTPEQLRSGRAR